ncbi:MAG TPA: GAP family protein [Acidimicrobiales bacterium]
MILDLFLIGLVVTLEPIPLTAMILLLASERGLLKGLGYVFGWLGTLVVIVAVVVVITGGKPLIPKTSPSTAALVIKLAAGVVLIGIAERRRRRLGSSGEPKAPKKQPRWMGYIDRVNPLTAAGLAFLLQPWVLVAAGMTTIVEGKFDTAGEYILVFTFCVWCSASYLLLETYAAVRPDKVQPRLQAILTWINTHRDETIVFLSLALGLYLTAKSVYGLVSA